jgi:hypothetical protein
MSRALRCFYTAAILSLAVSHDSRQAVKVDSVLDTREFIEDWKISKQFTLEVADAMPAESYDFKPNPEEMTFGEQLVHIAVGNAFRFQQKAFNHRSRSTYRRRRPRTSRLSSKCLLSRSTS